VFEVVYTHNRAHGLTYSYVVEAEDVETAKMRAGMARAESFAGWFAKSFFGVVTWERVSVERVG
jgi:hypothetical protein